MANSRRHPFALVCEKGIGNNIITEYESNVEARKAASNLWCCWCLYERGDGGMVQEVAHGGVGFSHGGIRKWAAEHFKAQTKSQDARAAAAAAAEARAAAAAAKQPKKPTVIANPLGGRDGKPDISNPVVWD
jgi:hypothetical protein